MRIITVSPLTKQVPERFSPSGANWILKCHLRGLFKNTNNKGYDLKNNYAAALGNVIHKILDINSSNRINTEEEFNIIWQLTEQEEQNGGLKYLVKNYARYKYAGKRLILKEPDGVFHERSNFLWQFLSERWLASSDGFLRGRPDTLVLKNGLPYEIKDYKTGQVFREDIPEMSADSGADFYDFIKDEYRNQLLLYAYLVRENYGFFPTKLTVVTPDGTEISGPCIPDEVTGLVSRIRVMQQNLTKLREGELASPSALNCRYCNYKPDCPFRIITEPGPYGDIAGTAVDINAHTFGNFTITLNSGQKIFMPQPCADMDSVLKLKGKPLFINNVKQSASHPDGYSFTKFSIIYNVQQ
ncbi:PD-(D/E)XK nuclease family protein [Mucilaginibacter jinjuensis]|uniref:PD-(D/E)XK nuclease family protein n=1 Tax=Mucilaginibacter jinjuensis TaxID=1176721 RepID=A0ABY7TC86_9SPHI|nr:PD-(D/E)XK nuclease family protein [Mucilaginibacter jinjuensis]WCT13794.1 PD-(D/E)XK nuclease family protein [Mucilaginibacter jinjuensis]